jgi:hypothetical protein
MKKNYSAPAGRIFVFFFILSIFFATGAFAQAPTSQTFNSNGTYTIATGFSANVTIEAWGAGGGGGSNTGGAKGGGGGGAYASLTTTLNAGSYTVSVGTGGGAGTAGGNSSFTSLVIAEGGKSTTGTTGGTAGLAANSTGSTTISGTNGANTSGNNGGGGGAAANGGGAGGAGGAANNGPGVGGTAQGGGGGGKAGPGNSSVSGAGAAGRVIVTVNSVLPVRLSSIKAFEKQNGIQIEWVSLTEENLSKYQIERSSDGSNFFLTGSVDALNIAQSKYGYYDANPLQGISFYRLKSVDNDGRSGYSSIVRVNLNKNDKEIRLYPNPVTDGNLSFQSSDLSRGAYAVRIFNAGGQQVYTNKFSHSGGALNQTIQLPGGMKAGMYNIQLDNDGEKVMSKTFMIK